MDLLVWTSLLIVCSRLSSLESRAVSSDQDLISDSGVHDTVKFWSQIPSSLSSSYPPLPVRPLNPPKGKSSLSEESQSSLSEESKSSFAGSPEESDSFPEEPKIDFPKQSDSFSDSLEQLKIESVKESDSFRGSPEGSDNVRLRENQSLSTTDHVQLPMNAAFRPPTGQFRPTVNDPAHFSGRPASSGIMIFGLNSNKKLPQISRLSGLIRGIYWMLDSTTTGTPSQTEQRNQKVVSDAEKWIKDVKTHRRVVQMQMEDDRLHCGNNYLVKFDDGSQACAKQRHNYDQIQGEIFAYFLADLLQMRHHLPPTVLVKAVNNRLFESVMDDIQHSPTWDPTKPLIITKYLTNLKPILLPPILHPLFKAIVSTTQLGSSPQVSGSNVTGGNAAPLGVDDAPLVTPPISPRSQQLGQLSREELRELVQWSDLVIFDYLLGNLDRMANSAVNLQWHQQMLSQPVHNIFQTADADGNFIFMDNESGLFHGYRLVDQYDRYLQPLLRSFCVFNKHTVNAIKKLHQSRSAGAQMMKMLSLDYPRLLNRLPGIGPKTSHILQKRLRFVFNHIRFCEENYFLP